MLVLICLLCLIIALAFIFFIKGENFAQKILTPIGLFILFHSFIFFVMPMLQELYGISRFPSYLVSNTDSYSMFLSVGSAFLYLIICTITVFILGKSGLDYSVLSSASLVSNDNTKLVKVVCIVFIAVGSFVMFGVVAQYVNQFAYFMYNRINLLSGYGYFIKMLVFSLPLSVLLVCEFVRQNKKNSLLLLIVTFGLVFIISLLLGSRAQALFMLPYVLITYIFISKTKINYRSLGKSLLVLILIFGFASSLAKVRDIIKQDDAVLSKSAIAEEIELGEVVTKELQASFGHAELLAFVLDNSDRYEFALGRTYVAGFVSFVPRVIWPGKPLGGGPMLANIVAPGSYKLGSKEGNSSLTTGVVIESYLNFGFVGVFVFAIIHGFLIYKVTCFGHRLTKTTDIALFLLTTNFLSMTIVNAEFLGAFSAFMFVAVIIYFFNNVRIRG